MRTESVGDILLSAVEGEVAEEESVRRLTDLISIGLASVVLLWASVGTSVGKVDVQGTTIEISTMLLSLSLGGVGGIDEFNVAESITR